MVSPVYPTHDTEPPSRIVAGVPKLIGDSRFAEENAAIEAIADLPYLEKSAKVFASLLQQGALKPDIDVLYMGHTHTHTDTHFE